MHVAIVALGPSADTYYRMAESQGGRRAFCDETWCINSNGDILSCDRIFHMDDMRVQEARAAAGNAKIGSMLDWMRKHQGPIYTSKVYPEYPGLVEFPLEEVINSVGTAYFNSTPAYAFCYAMYMSVTRISLFGIDFTWPNAHEAERGRACVEYWIGRAMQRGIGIFVAPNSTLLDANMPASDRFYGYDARTPNVVFDAEAMRASVSFVEKPIPTAEEIERRYDHTKGARP